MTRVIQIERLGKRYRLGQGFYRYRTIRESLSGAFPRKRGSADEDRFVWALKDIDLTIDDGEILGIIGSNGAGKTTLLRVVSRITQPTTGTSRTRGRVGALLDVGTGFHPELTGRENIFLNGAILGMSQKDVRRRFDEIVEFAAIERFLDTPLKRYSSGMYLRLAFSVAAHLEPDIVVVDEVLAVGDADFQRKCLGKMSDFTREGRTVLFVSHDLGAINNLCTRAIWLADGTIQSEGSTAETVKRYLDSITSRRYVVEFETDSDPDSPVRLREVAVVDEDGRVGETIPRDRPLSIRLRFNVREHIPGLDVAAYVVSRTGARILDEAWSDTGRPLQESGATGDYEIELTVPPVLAPSSYILGVWIGVTLAGADETYVDREVLAFEVDLLASDPQEWLDRNRLFNPTGVRWRVLSSPHAGRSAQG